MATVSERTGQIKRAGGLTGNLPTQITRSKSDARRGQKPKGGQNGREGESPEEGSDPRTRLFFFFSIRNYAAENSEFRGPKRKKKKKNLGSSLSNARGKEIGSQTPARDHTPCRKHRCGAPPGR